MAKAKIAISQTDTLGFIKVDAKGGLITRITGASKEKYDSIMNDVTTPYDGVLEAGPINAYLTLMTSTFDYQNVLNLELNIISTKYFYIKI